MSQYLRDIRVKNISMDENDLESINQYFVEKSNSTNISLGNLLGNENKKIKLSYIIRFDNKGYLLYGLSEMMKYYKQAREVERIYFILESDEYKNSNGEIGSHILLQFDINNANNCSFTVTSDNEEWVDSVFSNVLELINKYRNFSGFVRNNWFYLFIQLIGVILGFAISLWASLKISPYLTTQNAFVISFLFAILIFSNFWSVIGPQITRLLSYCFPNIRFKRKGREVKYWIIRTLIGAPLGSIFLYLIKIFYDIIGSVFKQLIKL